MPVRIGYCLKLMSIQIVYFLSPYRVPSATTVVASSAASSAPCTSCTESWTTFRIRDSGPFSRPVARRTSDKAYIIIHSYINAISETVVVFKYSFDKYARFTFDFTNLCWMLYCLRPAPRGCWSSLTHQSLPRNHWLLPGLFLPECPSYLDLTKFVSCVISTASLWICNLTSKRCLRTYVRTSAVNWFMN